MSLKQIIIVDEEGDTVTIQSSQVEYSVSKMENGKRRVTVGTCKSIDRILRHFIQEEWLKLKELGARLVTRIPWLNHKEKSRK